MKKLLVAGLIATVALLSAARPAKAGNQVGALLTGVAVGIGAALVLDALTPPVVAAPVVVPPPVVYPPPPVVVTSPSVVYVPPPVYAPAPVVYTRPPVVYRPVPVVVHARHHHPSHRGLQHGGHGKRHWKQKHTRHDD
jgi:hypothetical protein